MISNYEDIAARVRETGEASEFDGIPVLPAYDTGKQYKVWCKWCNTWHYHGRGEMVNTLLEEYRYNIIAAATGQTKVLSRDRWAYAFLVMAREVARLQAVIDGGELQFTFEEMRRDANNRWQATGEWPGYGPDAISERTGE